MNTAPYEPDAWETGPAALVYDALAAVALDRCPVTLDGATLLDAGAGTGAATKAAMRRGARVIASDISESMLAFHRGDRPPAAAADTRVLPFRVGAFDVVAVPFSLSHIDPPVAGLREVARVTRPGGAVVVSSFGPADRHPVKQVVQDALERWGWTSPAWYTSLKTTVEPLVSQPASLLALAAQVGLRDADARLIDVDLGTPSSRQLVRYRLGTAQVLPFLHALGPDRAAELEDEVVDRLGPNESPFVAQIALLVARA